MNTFRVMPDQLLQDFLDLIQIDSPSREERGVADWLTARLHELGCLVKEDKAGLKVGGNCGNLKVFLPGNTPGIGAMLFCAHMDTVEPARGVKPVIENGIIRSSGDTVLGSDDKAGVVVILHLARMIHAQPDLPRPDLEFLFNVCEEVGLLGAKALDTSDLKSVVGFVLDDHDPRGVTIKSPSAVRIDYKVIGRASHAGVEPEKGINALKVAADAISKMRLGRIDFETTANIGAIHGGKMSNIVLETVEMKAEARSHNPEKLKEQSKHMHTCFEDACIAWRKPGEELPRVEIQEKDEYTAVQLSESDYPVRLALTAGKRLDWMMETKISGGGTDGSIIHSKGIPTAVLGVGMQEVHSTKEYLRISDLEDAAKLVAAIVLTHAEGRI